MRALTLSALVCFAACNDLRDEVDEHTEMALDQGLAEKRPLLAAREQGERDQAALRARRAAFVEVTQAELEALAGEGAKGALRPEGFFDVVTVGGAGAKAAALRYLRDALARSPTVAATTVELAAGSWSVSVAVTRVATSPAFKPKTYAPAPDKSWCYASCRDRRKRIEAKAAELARLEAELGPLNDLLRDKKDVLNLESVRANFMSTPATLAVLDVLERAPWFDAGATAGFSRGDFSVAFSPGREASCDEALGALGSCSVERQGSVRVKLRSPK